MLTYEITNNDSNSIKDSYQSYELLTEINIIYHKNLI